MWPLKTGFTVFSTVFSIVFVCNHFTEEEGAGCFTLIDFYLLYLFLMVSWVCLQCVAVAYLAINSILYT